MRPVADSDAAAAARRIASDRKAEDVASATPPAPRDAADGPGDVPADVLAEDAALPPVARKPMKPIGPAALKALREAIRSGTYPSEDVVRDGIARLLRRGA